MLRTPEPVPACADALVPPDDVAVLTWPDDAALSDELGRAGRPRLLLVPRGATPPDDWDALTDWMCEPIDEREFNARIRKLRRLADQASPPHLDEHDVLWRGPKWVPLAPVEARLMALLIERRGVVVPRRDLTRAAWPSGSPGERSVDSRLAQLRGRIEPLGLGIRCVRRRGLMLEEA